MGRSKGADVWVNASQRLTNQGNRQKIFVAYSGDDYDGAFLFCGLLWFVVSDKFFSSPLFFLYGLIYYHTSRLTIGYFSTK